MKKFRLKKEATPFFKERLATSIQTYDFWEKMGIDHLALEEIEDAYISYGHESKRSELSSSTLSGWDDKGSRIHFTIHFPSVKMSEHDKFTNGKCIRGLMDRIQSSIDRFYSDFANDSELTS